MPSGYAELFVELRRRPCGAETLQWFREQKDVLFREHPQSPIPRDQRASFGGLAYWPYDPDARVYAHFAEAPDEPPGKTYNAGEEIAFRRIGQLAFELHGQQLSLAAFWIVGYAGGLFVPFKDSTNGHETYGAGRYVLDTIKSADLGSDAGTNSVILDFNYAYHPSCAYDPIWVCPLAPRDSRLDIPIHAGERLR
jgi:uncharacterized protein (DUF1684 family)